MKKFKLYSKYNKAVKPVYIYCHTFSDAIAVLYAHDEFDTVMEIEEE